MDFIIPRKIPTLPKEDWLSKLKKPNNFFDEDSLTFYREDSGGQHKAYYGFKGKLIYSSHILVNTNPMHTRYGLKSKNGTVVFNFPMHHPQRIAVALAIFKRRFEESHFVLIIAQDVACVDNQIAYWGDHLEGNKRDLFSNMSSDFTDLSKWQQFLAE
jgi:hypothetical protein